MKCRNDYEFREVDLRTEKQWYKVKKIPFGEGIQLYTNGYRQQKSTYFNPDEVRDMTTEEKKEFDQERKIKEQRRKQRATELSEKEKEKEIKEAVQEAVYETCKKLATDIMQRANTEVIPCENKSKTIVLDTETTGLCKGEDEIIQLSIIDGDGNILINTYVKPYYTTKWPAAQAVNNISPETIINAPYPHEIIPRVNGIIESATTIIGYNTMFDLEMLESWGVHPHDSHVIADVMDMFSPIYGEYNEYYENYKYQKLAICANYFGYTYKAHDSLEDAKATLHCYNEILKISQEQ